MSTIVIDCDAFSVLVQRHLVEAVAALLASRGWQLVTTESVYRHEYLDIMRVAADDLIDRGLFTRVLDPDSCDWDKKARKLRTRLQRADPDHRRTSSNDKQLLFLAMWNACCLLTCEKRLPQLADTLGFGACYDALDIVDALTVEGAIDAEQRRELLGSHLGAAGTLEAREADSTRRGGLERFECLS